MSNSLKNPQSRLCEVSFLIISGLALFLLLAIGSYHSTDPSWSHVGHGPAENLIGKIGAWVSDIFLYAFGYMAYLFPALMVMMGWMHLIKSEHESSAVWWWLRALGFALVMLSSCSLVNIFIVPAYSVLPASSGGVLGDVCAKTMLEYLNLVGATIAFIVLFLSGVTLSLGTSWIMLFDVTGKLISDACVGMKEKLSNLRQRSKAKESPRIYKPSVQNIKAEKPPQLAPADINELYSAPEPPAPTPSPVIKASAIKPSAKKMKKLKKSKVGEFLGMDLLDEPVLTQQMQLSNEDLEYLSREVEQRLLDYGVEVRVVAVHPGPVITRFELDLAPGIKASRITGLANDIARSLSAVSVRVVEVIPGKSTVGLELPNKHREIVYLREVLSTKQYQDAKSPISLALGKDISGHPVVVDLQKMPHLLVAGTTGSGKSVGLNAMLLSLLFKSTPEEVRLIMVDPKMLELSIYDGIPHLLTPVVTDMKEAANALRWCVAEMERRYRLMASQGVRNLAGYNDKIKKAKAQGKPIEAPEWYRGEDETLKYLEPLPVIVVVVDEFADMMMVVGKKVEQLIARIAQKARAAGVHLILATQRPSVNVITGLIKANIPTRIAFQVSSKIDSRTILDQQGAQQLLGHGDMLYMAPGSGVPVRVHGAFVADEEVHRVVAQWKQFGEPDYLDISIDNPAETPGLEGLPAMDGDSDGEKDALYDQAVQIVLETRRASISGVQRRLKIGYNRAARLVETMEEAGLVGPMESNGTREILVPEGQQ